MRIGKTILEAINSRRDDFYYKANDAEQELFKLKELTDNEETIKKLDSLILELNSIRMEEYGRDAIVEKYVDLPYDDFNAYNTIGQLKDGRLFIVFDDNTVQIVNGKMDLSEFKDIMYKDGDYINDFAEKNMTDAEDEIASSILKEIGRD